MVSVDKAVIARLMKAGKKFEILVEPELAVSVKGGKEIPADDLLAVPEVFEDVGKGTRVPAADVNKFFGTSSIQKIAEKIIREGDVQLTTEQRNKMQEEKTKAVAAIIAKNGLNPQTGAPHPQDRILRAMEQARVRIAIEKSADEQVDAVLKLIQPIIPIRFEKISVAIKIPSAHAGRAAGVIRNFGTPSREEWAGDGSYMAVVEIPAGMQTELFDKLNSLTHGEAVVKNLSQKK